MAEINEIKKIRDTVEELLQKMTIIVFNIELKTSSCDEILKEPSFAKASEGKENKNFIDLDITIEEPQVLIGHNGQTLFELQHILRIILNKKMSRYAKSDVARQNFFYLKLDINHYKKKKIEYLKSLALNLADEVSLTKEKKVLSPMPAYERRIIHMELSGRQDVVTGSQGEGINRCVVIRPGA